jgi:uncharacterized peroxidase-related enzyme
MTTFTLHTPETAPAASRAILENVEAAWKFIPNLHRILAESPATLEAYSNAFSLFDKSSFDAKERQVIYLAINYENECEYCMSGHSALAAMSGVDADAIEALRENTVIANPRMEALRSFAASVTRTRANLNPGEVEAFIAAGFTNQQVLEVILAVSVKTISNYVNHIAKTPLDGFMAGTKWVAPSNRAMAAR